VPDAAYIVRGMTAGRETRSTSVNSVHRAISILQVLARLGSAGVTEIATELSVHKSTVFRLLATLESRGLVEQTSVRGSYQIAFGIAQLAAGATQKQDLSVTGRQTCQELAAAVGDTVNIAVPDRSAVVSVEQVLGSAAVSAVNWVGQRAPIHATSSGKVFLAWMDDAERAAVLKGRLKSYTEHTITDRRVLEKQLAEVRAHGYSFTSEEHEIGLAAVAAPIRGLDGEIIAAVTVSGPTFRINESTIPAIAEQVVAAAAAISERNGYPKAG
jgi:IclR family transcriptional regulator, acetate operon repressor